MKQVVGSTTLSPLATHTEYLGTGWNGIQSFLLFFWCIRLKPVPITRGHVTLTHTVDNRTLQLRWYFWGTPLSWTLIQWLKSCHDNRVVNAGVWWHVLAFLRKKNRPGSAGGSNSAPHGLSNHHSSTCSGDPRTGKNKVFALRYYIYQGERWNVAEFYYGDWLFGVWTVRGTTLSMNRLLCRPSAAQPPVLPAYCWCMRVVQLKPSFLGPIPATLFDEWKMLTCRSWPTNITFSHSEYIYIYITY